jgi:hypothetical protein
VFVHRTQCKGDDLDLHSKEVDNLPGRGVVSSESVEQLMSLRRDESCSSARYWTVITSLEPQYDQKFEERAGLDRWERE